MNKPSSPPVPPPNNRDIDGEEDPTEEGLDDYEEPEGGEEEYEEYSEQNVAMSVSASAI